MDISFNKNHSCGKEEHGSESDRKMKQQSKKTPLKSFMAPTISAKSKTLSPKKRVLTEWNENSININHQKSSNLGKKSSFNELGVSKQPLTEISILPFPVLSTKDDENVDIDVGFDVPYDPLTNYLSPRPKFLRYNPNRLRNRVILDVSSRSSTSVSLDSLSSVGSSIGENCMIKGREKEDDKAEVVDEDEEEVIEERKWDLIWEVLKCLTVFSVLIVSSMYTTSMNLNVSLFVDHKYGNITSDAVSLFENDPICVESDRIMGYNIDDIAMSKASNLGYFIDQGPKMDNDVIVESETSSVVGSNEGNLVNSEPKCQVEEILAQVFFEGIEGKDTDYEAKSNDGALEIEHEVFVDASEVENVGDEPQLEAEMVGKKANSKIELIDEDGVEFEAELVGEEADEEMESMDEDNVEYEQNEITLQTQNNVVLVLILSIMTLVGSFLVKFYYKCKNPCSKTTSASNVKKLCSKQPPKVEFRSREKKPEPMQIDETHLDSLSIAPPLPRVIPKVKVLSQFSIDGEVRSESDMTSKGGSESIGCYLSKEMASNKNAKEEAMAKATPTPLRRSSRLRNREVTSP